MPKSEKERNVNVSTGDITVENITENLTSDTVGGVYLEVEVGTYSVAAGAYEVRVKNSGTSGSNITVNGDEVSPANEWVKKAHENRNTGKTDFCPAVVIIVPAGCRATYQTETPS